MSFTHRDLKFGCNYYETVENWQKTPIPGSGTTGQYCVSGMMDEAFDDIDTRFDHIYVIVEELNSSGEKQTTIEDIGFTLDQLELDFISEYADRLMYMPYYPESNDGNARSYTRMKNVLAAVVRQNYGKWIKLMETLGYTYDPISNYDMQEISGDAEKEGAREDNKSIRGQKVITESAPETQVKVYTTTFDDDTTGRLQNYSTQEYKGTYPVDNNVPVKRTKEFYEGDNPGETSTLTHTNQVSLTQDTITTPSADKAYTHKLIRRGNIGVTTSQQMIEAQRDLVKFSLEREILNDIANAVLLKTWG